MARKPLDTSDETLRLTIRLTKQQLALLDSQRGGASRSSYVRELIEHGMAQKTLRDIPPMQPTRVGERMIVVEPLEPVREHLHRYIKGDEAGYVRGTKVYLYTCECGETEVR